MTTLTKFKFFLKVLGLLKIPMIGYVNPKLLVLNDETVKVKIKLKRRTKNHLNSMYFGALAVGADLTAGIHAFHFSKALNKKVSFAFKGMEAEFIKRAESDVTFVTNDGQLIKQAVYDSLAEKKRINKKVKVNAINQENEIVATFVMISSIKVIES